MKSLGEGGGVIHSISWPSAIFGPISVITQLNTTDFIIAHFETKGEIARTIFMCKILNQVFIVTISDHYLRPGSWNT